MCITCFSVACWGRRRHQISWNWSYRWFLVTRALQRLNPGALQEQAALLTAEPSLHLYVYSWHTGEPFRRLLKGCQETCSTHIQYVEPSCKSLARTSFFWLSFKYLPSPIFSVLNYVQPHCFVRAKKTWFSGNLNNLSNFIYILRQNSKELYPEI